MLKGYKDQLESIQLSQDELKLLLAILNLAVKSGQLQLGDVMLLSPIATKIDALVVKDKPIDGEVIEPKNN